MSLKKTHFITIICSIFFFALSAKAEVTNDLQNWSVITLNKSLDDHWGLYVEAQNRLGQNFTGERRILLRPALVYKINKNVSLWMGYAWTPSFTNGNLQNESRLWQQVAFNKHLSEKLESFGYFRLEERFIEGAGATSMRNRLMAGLKYPILKSKTWKWVAFDEFFVNYYSVNDGPQAGFDQNRVFAGVEKTFNEHLSLTTGYLLDYVNVPNQPDQLLHSVRTHLNVNL